MENKFTPEQIEKARECKTVAELLALAQGNGIEITEAEAQNLFAQLNPANGELSDSELETVAGGCGDSQDRENHGHKEWALRKENDNHIHHLCGGYKHFLGYFPEGSDRYDWSYLRFQCDKCGEIFQYNFNA